MAESFLGKETLLCNVDKSQEYSGKGRYVIVKVYNYAFSNAKYGGFTIKYKPLVTFKKRKVRLDITRK